MQKHILYLLSLGHMVTDINQGLLPIFLSVYKQQAGLTFTAASFIAALSNISSSVIQPLFGYLSDKYQLRWLLPAGCLLAGLGMAAFGLVRGYYLLVALVFVSGLGVAAYHPEASKSAHYISGPLQAGSMAIFSVGGNLGFGLGPIIASLILTHGGLKSSWLVILPTILTVALLVHSMPAIGRAMGTDTVAAAAPQKVKTNYSRASLTAVTLLVLVVILRSWLHTGLTYYIPFYYQHYLHGDAAFASTMLSIFLIAGAVGTLVGGRIADYWGAKRMILASMLVLIPLVLAFPYVKGAWVAILLALSGFFVVSTFAPAIVLAQSLMPRHIGMASGLMMGFAIGTGGLGLLLLGGVADARGVPFVIHLLAIVPALAAVLTLPLPDIRRQMARDH
ncbi:MFS transporter [Moorella sulfitireducens (nom. illeg.)]|uniref:MFS transporter n=1 Tax=Neomoorella sulfitireducens TaxID=2972948 RepID=UPI0021AD0D29|nr:MFS transporter [Moorella sulfitireducens]